MKRSNAVFAFILLFAGALGFIASIYMHPQRKLQKDTTRVYHHPLTFVSHLNNDKQAGAKIFKEFCSSCHGKNPVIPLNAPRIGNKKRWSHFKGIKMQSLIAIVASGVGAMPARGGCFECSDKQLGQAIQYILDNS